MGNSLNKQVMVTVKIEIDTVIHEYTLSGQLTVKDLLELINEYRMQPVLKLTNKFGVDVPLTSHVNEFENLLTHLKAIY